MDEAEESLMLESEFGQWLLIGDEGPESKRRYPSNQFRVFFFNQETPFLPQDPDRDRRDPFRPHSAELLRDEFVVELFEVYSSFIKSISRNEQDTLKTLCPLCCEVSFGSLGFMNGPYGKMFPDHG